MSQRTSAYTATISAMHTKDVDEAGQAHGSKEPALNPYGRTQMSKDLTLVVQTVLLVKSLRVEKNELGGLATPYALRLLKRSWLRGIFARGPLDRRVKAN